MVEDEVTIGCIIHAGLTRGSDQTNHSLFSPCLLSFDDQFQAPQWTEKERENVSNPDSESSCLSRKLELSLFKIPGYSIEYAYQRRGSKISEITQWRKRRKGNIHQHERRRRINNNHQEQWLLQSSGTQPPILLVRGRLNTIVPHHSAFK